MQIRQATMADSAELARLNLLFNEVAMAPEQIWAQIMAVADLETALIAYDQDRACGFICVRISRAICSFTPVAEVTELFVEPLARRVGVGRALIQAAEALASQAGATELQVATGIDNQLGQHFYQQSGFLLDHLLLVKSLV